jgi:cytochrome P450
MQFAVYYRLHGTLARFFPIGPFKARESHHQLTAAKLQRRLKQETPGKDFISYIVDNDKGKRLSDNDLLATAVALLIAGKDTSASALTAATFFLLRNPRTYDRLVEEVRSSFTSGKDITMTSTNRLHYLQAVIQEALRLYPPIPCSMPRWVPEKGEMIEGKWVPGGVSGFRQARKSDDFRPPH